MQMQQDTKKIALFVDFDNIYLGLRETSREAADAFATRPGSWLKWIEHGMQLNPDADRNGPKENRVLIRRCYLNPDTFGKYRGYFTHAGFTVVDCPTLTSRGKNSSDIVMVMDILDALRHETHFDRFVIMSADADFTPVLQRLRAHDRRTAVLVSGQAAPAYRAACDRLITEDQFIELALEMPALPEPQRPAPASASPLVTAGPAASAANRDPELLAAIGQRVYEEASSSGTLSASELPRILREFKEFTPSSNWLGYYSLQNLAEAVLAHRPELRITNDDPWRIAVHVAEEPAAPAADGGRPAAPAQQPGAEWGPVRDRVVERVSRMVAESADPVVMGKAAHVAIQEAGPLITETRWLGKGTFKNLLLSAPDLPFRVVASPLPGYLYDPARHADPRQRVAVDGLAELDGETASLIRRIHQLTDAPKLTPRQYRVLWEVIAKEITRAPYSLMSTGKSVRDQCVERGEPIARQSITLVLRGLGYAGYRFWDAPHRPDNLAYSYRGNLLNLLRQAQVTLSDDELRMLDDWLMGPIAEEPHEPSQPAAASSATDADSADANPPSAADPAPVPSLDAQPADPAADGDAPSAEPVPAIEPDFAAADALPAQESHQSASPENETVAAEWQPSAEPAIAEPVVGSVDETPPDPVPAPPAEDVASTDEQAADASPAEDAVSVDAQVADASPSEEVVSVDAQPADASPADEVSSAERPAVDASRAGEVAAAEGQAPDAAPAASTAADPELADAISAELSDDHGPAGPDEVEAEWEMSAEPPVLPPNEPEPDEQSDAPSAEAPPAREPPHDEIVTAEWQPADAPPAPEVEPAAAPAPEPSAASEPTEAPAPSAPAPDEIVAAEWQPVDEAAAGDAEPDATSAPEEPAPSETRVAQPTAESGPNGDIFTPFWELEDGTSASSREPAAPSAPASQANNADAAPGEPVTPHFEVVGDEEQADGAASTDAPADPAAQMDAFPPATDPSRNDADAVPAEVPPSSDAEPPRDDPNPQQPLW
jgi:hypothetical protein